MTLSNRKWVIPAPRVGGLSVHDGQADWLLMMENDAGDSHYLGTENLSPPLLGGKACHGACGSGSNLQSTISVAASSGDTTVR